MKVLVTGCGGDIGYNIGRILKQTTFVSDLYGVDIKSDHPGFSIYDYCFEVPKASDRNYILEIEELVKNYDLNIIIVTSEAEIEFFNKLEKRHVFDAKLIYASQKAVNIGLDKFLTADFLKTNGLPFPKTEIASSQTCENFKYPCIVKARRSQGSKVVKKIEKVEDILPSFISDENIFQELLQPDNEEYTCGLFRTKEGEIRHIIFKRKLQGGITSEGEVIENKVISNLLVKLADKIELVGSINIQLRLVDNVPKIFEINPRFSSTVYFRYLFGFNDVVWSILDQVGEDISTYTPPPAGKKFYRVGSEVIL